MGSILFSKSSIFIMVFSRDFHEKIKGKYGRFVRTFKNLKKSWKCRCIKMWTQFQKEFQHMFLFFAAVSFSDKKWNQASRERIGFMYVRNISSTYIWIESKYVCYEKELDYICSTYVQGQPLGIVIKRRPGLTRYFDKSTKNWCSVASWVVGIYAWSTIWNFFNLTWPK